MDDLFLNTKIITLEVTITQKSINIKKIERDGMISFIIMWNLKKKNGLYELNRDKTSFS